MKRSYNKISSEEFIWPVTTDAYGKRRKTVKRIGFRACTSCSLSESLKEIDEYDTLTRYAGIHADGLSFLGFDPESGKFSAPEGGRYHIHFSVDHNDFDLYLYMQTMGFFSLSEACSVGCDTANSPFHKRKKVGTKVLHLNTGDTIHLRGKTAANLEELGKTNKEKPVSICFAVSYLGPSPSSCHIL